jgi:ubiquinone biosynthesis protein
VLLRLFQTARRFNMEVQPQLVLLQKTLLNIEGLGRQLYPELDLWKTAKPFLERTMSEQLGARSLLRNLRESIPAWNKNLPEMPVLAHRFLDQATSGKLQVEWTSRDLKRLRLEIRRANRRSFNAIIGTGLFVTAAIIYGLDGHQPLMVMGAPLLSWICVGAGLFLLAFNWPDNSES